MITKWVYEHDVITCTKLMNERTQNTNKFPVEMFVLLVVSLCLLYFASHPSVNSEGERYTRNARVQSSCVASSIDKLQHFCASSKPKLAATEFN